MSLTAVEPPRLSDLDWRWALPRIAALFIVTRLLVLAVAVSVELTQPDTPEGVAFDDRPIVTSLTAWDGTWHLGIAADGYHAEPTTAVNGRLYVDYAFYPLYPAVTRIASLAIDGDVPIAGLLVANGAFALALVALYALSVRFLTPKRALLSLWFLALAPGAAAFSMSYSESLFLLFAVSAFLAAETRHPWIAGIAVALATLTRAPGILLVLPLAVLYIQRDGLRPTKAWIPLVLAPLALGGFFAFLWRLTGDPLAPLTAQSYWDRPEFLAAAVEAQSAAVTEWLAEPVRGSAGSTLGPIWVGLLIFHLFLFVFFRPDRIRPAYWLVAILAFVSVVLAASLMSGPRFLAVAWPFAWVLANRRSRVGQAVVLVAYAALQSVALWSHFNWITPP